MSIPKLNAEVDAKRKENALLWPEDLVVDPAKRGRHFAPSTEAIEALAADIDEKGQLQAITGALTHDRRVEIIAGFSRYYAFCLLNSRAKDPSERRRIEVKIIDANPEESFLANISENRMRNRTTCIDDAHNIRTLAEKFHKTDEELRTIYGTPDKPMSPSWLEGMRSLVRLPKEDQMKIHTGELSQSVGIELAAMDPALRAQVLAVAKDEGNGKVTTTSVRAAARKVGAVNGVKALKAPEIRKGWQYLRDNDQQKYPKVAKLAGLVDDWQAGKLAEPDFFGRLRRLLG